MFVSKHTKCSIAIIGDSGVGKSSILCRHIHSKFNAEYTSTIEDFYTTMAKVKGTDADDKWYELDIVDTAGLDEFQNVRQNSLCRKDGFVFVYDITSPSSFMKVHEFLRAIRHSNPKS
jgi:small GTP-binding protein